MNTDCYACKLQPAGSKTNAGGYPICDACWLRGRQVKAGILNRYLPARISQFPEGAKEKLQAIAGGRSGYIWGSFGIGKTHALAAAVTAQIESGGKGIRVVTWGDLCRGWRSSFKNKTGDEGEFFEEYAKQPSLFVDDVADRMGEETHGIKAMFCDLVDRRYALELHTVMTSNLSPTELGDAFSPKLTGRIVETYTILEFKGRDRRQPAPTGGPS